MSTLLLRLAGPMQSWGMTGRFTRRTTELQPTKSGVVGMLAAALGRRRTDSVADLAGLRMGVRVEQPGRLMRDFQTANQGRVIAPLSYRYFLSDAVFLAAVEGPDELIGGLDSALASPTFPLYLGRRAFPPAGPPSLGVHEEPVTQLLETLPWKASPLVMRANQNGTVLLRAVIDAKSGEVPTTTVEDVPLSFDPNRRLFSSRPVVDYSVTVANPGFDAALRGPKRDRNPQGSSSSRGSTIRSTGAAASATNSSAKTTDHDPFGFIGGTSVSEQV